jgi:PAS domain-containing protein
MTFKSRLLDEVLGHPDPDLARPRPRCAVGRCIRTARPMSCPNIPAGARCSTARRCGRSRWRFWRGDGRLIDLEMHAGPVRNETGEIVAAVAVALDVTERRLAEARQAFLFQLQDALRALPSRGRS